MKVVFGGKVVALISTCDGRWLFSTEVGSKTNVAGTDKGKGLLFLFALKYSLSISFLNCYCNVDRTFCLLDVL